MVNLLVSPDERTDRILTVPQSSSPYASPMTVCPACGHENAAGAKFCSECGTRLAHLEQPARTERKVVTVLFADLVGFTAQAERLDPEDVKAILRPYHERLRAELERFGGTVEKFIGDAVMALFGAPIAHEDDPERAIRAALAIREWIVEERKLQVRIGINTGEALVDLGARPDAGEGMAAGDVVNTAARLQTAAPPNGILAGETTYRATQQTIEYGDAMTIEAKGKEDALSVYEVLQARERFGVDVAPRPTTPLIGRARELELLRGTLNRAIEQRATELVTLIGVPGIGKSRLTAELFAAIETGEWGLVYWRQGRSPPYGAGISYWALAEMVKAQAGILETDNAREAEKKLTRAVGDLVDEDTDWVRSHLLPLVGQGAEAVGASREEAFAAWRRFFEAMAERHPLVLIFEDIQWADEGLLDFVEHLVDWVRGTPMLILCTARLELLARRPSWGGGKLNASTLALAPLSDEETASLISSLSDRPVMEAETQSMLLERAGGNPLYAEQYVRMLAERRTTEELPESVQGIIAARLDSLPPDEKTLLQDAAVIGKVFWLGALGATDQQLHALEQKQFLQRARRSSVAGQTEFAFKHLLVRDVAYGQIPRVERARKHLRAAEWIASLGRAEDHAEMVAHHYVSALELSRASGRDVDAFAERAQDALREAGDRATALNALDQAGRYYEEALALSPKEPALLFRYGRVRYSSEQQGADELAAARDGLLAAGDRETAAEAVIMLADIAWHAGQRDEMATHLDAARSLVEGMPPSRSHVLVLCNVARYEMLADRADAAIELGQRAIALAEGLGLDDLRAHAFVTVGTARSNEGDRMGLRELEQGLAIASSANAVSEMIRAHNNLAVSYLMHGELQPARVHLEETLRLAEHFGQRGFERFTMGGPGVTLLYKSGDWDESAARADRFLAEVEGGVPNYNAAVSYAVRGLMRAARGEPEAELDAERAVELGQPARDPQVRDTARARAAFIHVAVGNGSRAQALLDEVLEDYRDESHLSFSAIEIHCLAWAALTLGRPDDILTLIDREPFQSPWVAAARAVASNDLLAAADILGALEALPDEAFYRLRAAEQLVSEGRRAEADEQLRRALAFWRGVGATRYTSECEALLAASA
jgi:class 3 adenylate cyclase/tetratricopeptide (TPR) repeat protein